MLTCFCSVVAHRWLKNVVRDKLACNEGVISGRANFISSRSFIRPAMFDLELEWTPLLIFDCRQPLWYKFLSLPSLPLPLKSKMVVIIFVKKILSTRPPKLRLLCKLEENKLAHKAQPSGSVMFLSQITRLLWSIAEYWHVNNQW